MQKDKHTLKEFEKEFYYTSDGIYEGSFKHDFLDKGYHTLKKKTNKDATPGNYIIDAAGFRDAGHLYAPSRHIAVDKFKKLGHV